MDEQKNERVLWDFLLGTNDSGSSLKLQTKTVTPVGYDQTISPSTGYDALRRVILLKIPDEYVVPEGTIDIRNDGIYDVTRYSYANVSTPYSQSGTLDIPDNGMYDVLSFASASVMVPGAEAADIVERTFSGEYINSNVSTIGIYAFYKCSLLSMASCQNVSLVGDYAFSSCAHLLEASFPTATSIGISAFANCTRLSEVYMPNLGEITMDAFYCCYSLAYASFPAASTIGTRAFYRCTIMSDISIPKAEQIGVSAFCSCNYLSTISFPKATSIAALAFVGCRSLVSLYLLGSSNCALANSNAFTGTPIAGYTTYSSGAYGSIYVRQSLYDGYISSANWSYYSSRFVSLTDAEIEALDQG